MTKKNRNKLMLSSGFALTLLFSPLQQAFAENTEVKLQHIDTIAHRGASGYAPENTIASYDKGLGMNADYIELDVQRSKDGKLVVIHDTTVDRTTDGTGKVKDLSFEQLRSLDAGSWKGDQFAGEKIPAFDEILKRYHGKIGILIELKSPELYPGIEEQVTQAIKQHRLDKSQNKKIILQSFNFNSMKKMDQLLPKVPIGVLTSAKTDTTEQALQNFAGYADYFNPGYGLVNSGLVERVHALGMIISPWTVRTQEDADFLIDMKVDGIITDYPDYVNNEEKEKIK